MRKIIFVSLLSIILSACSSCSTSEFWGDKKIVSIEGTDNSLQNLDYDDLGRLSHYKFVLKEHTIYSNEVVEEVLKYDVSFEYTDSTIVVKGYMPYKSYDEKQGYADGIAVYTLGKDNNVKSGITIHKLVDSMGVESESKLSTEFRYKDNQLVYLALGNDISRFDYVNNNREYDYGKNAPALVTTFIDYDSDVNKSCLIGTLNEKLSLHLPIFYAHKIGRPSKNLLRRQAKGISSGQLISEYGYITDDQGYVTEMIQSRRSSLRLMGQDPLSDENTYNFTYLSQTDGE